MEDAGQVNLDRHKILIWYVAKHLPDGVKLIGSSTVDLGHVKSVSVSVLVRMCCFCTIMQKLHMRQSGANAEPKR